MSPVTRKVRLGVSHLVEAQGTEVRFLHFPLFGYDAFVLKSDLEAAIAACGSQREIADYFGHKSCGSVRYWAKRHGLTLPITNGRKWTDEQLVVAVGASVTMSAVMRALGFSDRHAGARQTIRRRIDALGLDTTHWRGSGFGRSGYGAPAAPLSDILVSDSSYPTAHLRDRLLREGLKVRQCERCFRTEWEGEPIPLELDHINGVSNDHRFENLRLLCPNCHALTPTWRGRKRSASRVVSSQGPIPR